MILCPSNPYLSVDPILAAPGLRAAIEAARAPVVAVSPIIGGRAIKGPTTKIMAELGVPADNAAIARHYEGLIDGLIVDLSDAGAAPGGVAIHATPTLMRSLADRDALAAETLAFAARLRAQGVAGRARR